jgi:hypothetical protein
MSFLALAKRFPTFDSHFDTDVSSPILEAAKCCLGLGREGQDG